MIQVFTQNTSTFISQNLGIQAAFNAWNFKSTSTIPVPPSSIFPIIVFRLILHVSVLFHMKLKIWPYSFLITSSFGNVKIDATYINLLIPSVLTIS